VGGQHHAPAALPPGKTRYPLYSRLGGPQGRSGRVRKISPPPEFDPRTVQPVAQSLYRLSYPAHRCTVNQTKKKLCLCAYLLWSDIVTKQHVCKERSEQCGSFQVHHGRHVESSQIRRVRYLTYLSPATSSIEMKSL
jgi:hypothetical protein